MGSCQSSSDDAEMPKLPSSILQNKFKVIEKTVFQVPIELGQKPQVYTSNGKITDFITKSGTPIYMAYQQSSIESSLDSDKKYEDKQFPREQKSLGAQAYAEKIEWIRAQELLKKDFTVFEGQIQPNDIKQGKLGDCYLLSAIACISEFPFIVKRLFQTTQPSSYGYYGIWLFIDGLWKCVVIDDYFPTHGGKPFYSRNHGKEIWVMLLEKAYAKIFKNYQNIQSGLTGIALNALTGAPFEYLNKNSKDSIGVDDAWKFLTQNLSMNHLMTGSSQNNDRNGNLGLVSSHAYTILDVQEVHMSTKKGKITERILKMQNPWGKYEWKGRWGDDSDVWNEELKEQLKYQKSDDGIFWININDFVENFGQICASKYNKNYITTSLSLLFSQKQQNGYKGVFMRVSNRTEGYLCLIQRDHRFYEKGYEYSLIRLIALKLDKMTSTLTQYINDLLDCDRDGHVKIQLDPGDYYLLVQVDWKSDLNRTLVVQFYGQHPVNFVEDKKQLNIEGLFNEIVLLHEKYTQKDRIYEYAKDNKIKRVTGSIAGYVYYHYTNKSTENNYLCETVSLKQKKSIDVFGEKNKDQFTVKVYPDEERIVKLKVNKSGNSFYSFSTKIQFYIVEKYSLQKLKQLADKKPTKIKKRQIDGKQIDVRVKTYNYSGGIVMLYQNKMDKYAYIEEIIFEIDNLELQNETLTKNNKLQIELEPQSQKLLSFVVSSPGKEIVFRTKMSFYLNAPQFKF